MKILQVAPIDIAVTDNLKYAGTERIVYALNREYSNKKLECILTASGDSNVNGYGFFIPTIEKSLWTTDQSGSSRKMIRSNTKYEEHYKKSLDIALNNNSNIIHDHPGQYILNSESYLKIRNNFDIPIITTIHEDIQENVISKIETWKMLQKEKREIIFIGISETHRRKYEREAGIEIPNFVYNGLEIDKFDFKKDKKNYLFWIGRLSDIKGTDIAVQVSLKTKIPLIIAGEVHDSYKEFYKQKVEPFITKNFVNEEIEKQERERENLIYKLENEENIIEDSEIFFIGPLNDRQKAVFYKNAKAVLVPNRWEEPFGLISIEGMATGTPIIGTNRGALPEVIKNGETGYIVDIPYDKNELDERSLVNEISESIKNLDYINPIFCRKRVEDNFTSKIMAENYISIYREILNK